MPLSLTYKILKAHLMEGTLAPGAEIGLKIDQTLTQDATGTMAYLQFMAMGISVVKTKLSVSYVDHNMLQTGFENADDHRFLQSAAAKYGIYFSRPGNGICHQVHRERFGIPGQTLLGSDSHTPTCGGLGMLAMGAGGLDVAVAMAGRPYFIRVPKVCLVKLTGKLQPFVTGKDIILEVLRRLTVKGGIGKIMEYGGPGVSTVPVADRFTVTNMGAELGATTSIFPSDQLTKEYLAAQGRGKIWKKFEADPGAGYDEMIEIDLDQLEPMIAKPHSPDNVVKVSEVAGTKASQVCIGSCTNSSYHDLAIAAKMLEGHAVHPNVSMTVTPGSKQVFEMIARSGALQQLISAGARILESACGPCIGMGQAPGSGAVSVRSFNRNFEGRSGTADAQVYLASPETCAATALKGEITDPRIFVKQRIKISAPKSFVIADDMIVKPPRSRDTVEILMGPNIKPLPQFEPLADQISGRLLLKVGDNITTDHIMPAGAKVLPLRSNVPAISQHVFVRIDPEFPKRCKEWGGGIIVGGTNYGQGSSREHAALAPRYLGVKAVIVKSFSRIHWANLINFGILPLVFDDAAKSPTGDDAAGYEAVQQGDELRIEGLREALQKGTNLVVKNLTQHNSFKVSYDLTDRQKEILLAGGLLNWCR